MIKKRQKILNIVALLLQVFVFVSACSSFSNTSTTVKNAELSFFDAEATKKHADYYYTNMEIEDSEKQRSIDTMFLDNYVKNFSGKATYIITVTGHEGITNFKTSFNDIDLPFTSTPVSGRYYTNKESPARLETVHINLLMYREKHEEISFNNKVYDGFIYIPDYYADYIIEHNDSIEYYTDLFDSEKNYKVSFTYRDRFFNYKIANIFHVQGFKDDYLNGIKPEYDDYKNGKKLDYLLNGYCFVSNYDHFTLFDDRFYNTLLLETGAKKYQVEEALKLVNYYSNQNNAKSAKATIFYHTKDGIIEYSGSDKLTAVYILNAENKVNVYWLIIGGIALAAFFVISIFNFIGKMGFEKEKFYFLCSGVISISFMLTSFILKKLLVLNLGIQKFFNSTGTGIIVGIFFIMVAGLFFVKNGKVKEK